MDYFEALNESVDKNNVGDIKTYLDEIITFAPTVVIKENSIFLTLLNYEEEISLLTVRAIAELSKSEENRLILSDSELLGALLKLFSNEELEHIDLYFRAIGNLCFDNDRSREYIGVDGVQIILQKCDLVIDHYIETSSLSCTELLFGCLLNLLMSNDELQKVALSTDIVGKICKVFPHLCKNIESNLRCILYVTQVLSMIIDHIIDEWLPESLCLLLVDVVKYSMDPELTLVCLEILKIQLENGKFLIGNLFLLNIENIIFNVCILYLLKYRR